MSAQPDDSKVIVSVHGGVVELEKSGNVEVLVVDWDDLEQSDADQLDAAIQTVLDFDAPEMKVWLQEAVREMERLRNRLMEEKPE